jgi:rubrerythrin
MMSEIPKSLSKMRREDLNREILRAGMIAELDAINLYEQLAAMSSNPDMKRVLADIAKEEKTHMAEFETLLLRLDKEQVQENEKGKKEVEELTGKER